jgi:hypothetical protein
VLVSLLDAWRLAPDAGAISSGHRAHLREPVAAAD